MSRILQLTANNVMRLTAVNITPGDGSVVLTGKNTHGKTSVLKSIMAVLAGAKERPDRLLRDGAEKGEVVLTIGDTEPELIARLKVTPEGETLTVTTAAGAKYQSPQSILDGLRGAVGWEPMTFLQKKPPEQAAMLQKLVGLNFTEIDAKRAALFDERTATNREVKQAETVYGTMPSYDIVETVEVSVADLTEQLQGLNEINTRNGKMRQIVDNLKEQGRTLAQELKEDTDELNDMEAALARKKKTIEEKAERLSTLRSDYEKHSREAKALVNQPIDAIQAKIATAEFTNRKVRANEAYKTWGIQMDATREASAALTRELDAIDKSKRDQLAAAKMPVANLSFTSEGVLLNNRPLEDASGAEQLIVALGMGIAANSKLKVLLFRDASLLDSDSRKIVDEFCEKNGTQAWLEIVDTNEPGAVVIQDGSTKGAA